ncbi:MAG: AhpC/TSA family protein [Planctomycetota bacterium]
MHSGSPAEGERFFAERWPEARAVSDPEKVLYAGFDLGRGSFGQLFGPRSFAAAFRALRFGVGRPAGDPLMLSGWFLVEADGGVVWSHRHDFAGDEPRLEQLQSAFAGA